MYNYIIIKNQLKQLVGYYIMCFKSSASTNSTTSAFVYSFKELWKLLPINYLTLLCLNGYNEQLPTSCVVFFSIQPDPS